MNGCLSDQALDVLARDANARLPRHLRRCTICCERLAAARTNLTLLEQVQELDTSRERIQSLLSPPPEDPTRGRSRVDDG